MDWTVYWFMFPVCVAVAGVAMFSGISGAALLLPVFLIGFPVFDVPLLGTVEAIAVSLFLETSGFGVGVYRYVRRRLVDLVTAGTLVLFTLPLGVVGAVVAQHAPEQLLRVGYGFAMLALAVVLARAPASHASGNADGDHNDIEGCPEAAVRVVHERDGTTYRYCAERLGGQRLLSGGGAFVAGMISTGVGEATLPSLVRRSRFPIPVAAATSTVVVATTVFGAAVTHLVQLAGEGGLSAVPWNLIVWAVPGAVVGAVLGTRLQGRVSEATSRRFFSAMFAAIGVTFLLAFTVFRGVLA